jgi:GR25 family glycosyltransferase involved in LPS biosynthesis
MIAVFEDDVLLSRDCSSRMKSQIEALRSVQDPFIVYLGDALTGSQWHSKREKLFTEDLYYQEDKTSRCADSYLINSAAIHKIVEKFDDPKVKMHVPIDHYFTFVARDNNFTVLWAEPTYATQTSMWNFQIE